MNPLPMTTDFDLRTQFLALSRAQGDSSEPSEKSKVVELSLVARITNLEAWKELAGVHTIVTIRDNHEWYVTARATLPVAMQINTKTFVLSLKVARVVQAQLQKTIEDLGLAITGQQYAKLPGINLGSNNNYLGAGVIVGIIDYGCDFAHRNFRTGKDFADSRILYLWDQRACWAPTHPYRYGSLYKKSQLEQALKEKDPCRALGYKITPGAHGTHVMDIAAGSGKQAGVAPRADIIFVHIDHDDVDALTSNFGDEAKVIEATQYIFEKAKEMRRPCVINLSLGTHGGPHDGSSPVEKAFDALLRNEPNRAVVISAGNNYNDKCHQQGQVKQGGYSDLEWMVTLQDPTPNELEVWYSGQDEFEVEILSADPHESVLKVPLGKLDRFLLNNKPLFVVSHRKNDPDNGDNVIDIIQNPQADPDGNRWVIRLHGKKIQSTGRFHAWIERDNIVKSKFYTDIPSHTLGSIACGEQTIAVGSYDAHQLETPLSFFTSSGPTRSNRQKPEVSAPGHDVWAACSLKESLSVPMSGTSMAAPAVTGLVALIFSLARAKGKELTIDQTRQILIDTARRVGDDWHPRYGYGKVSAEALNHPLLKK